METKEKLLFRIYGDIGSFKWDKDAELEDPAFLREVGDAMCFPEEFPVGELEVKLISVSNVVGVYDGDEIVAVVFNMGEAK
ncbi:MAG TPA: hypothetical protein VMV58_01855 [Desulfosporosinus sp.]|nr:hypothetical protein [Desulfosporosinus sp.]